MIIPTIHLNGTSKEELERQLADAASHLGAAIAALMDAAPHGRDYYPQGVFAYQQAAVEHEDRIRRLKSVYAELEELHLKIMESAA